MKVLLFLGSGVSRETVGQDVSTITEEVLNGAWHSHTDSNFYRGFQPPQNVPERWVTRHQDFLRLLKKHSDDYLKKRRRGITTYEDLFFLAQQVEDEVRGEIDHVLLAPFTERLRTETRELCKPIGPIEREYDLARLASESCDLIQCAVWHLLRTNAHPKGFDLLTALATAAKIDRLDICTLNHDLLIERTLQAAKSRYADGFGERDGDIRWFAPDSYDDPSFKVRLYKLHGSINLWRFERERGKRASFTYGLVPDNQSILNCKATSGERVSEVDARPTFLTGTYNKMLDYRYGVFAYVHNRFFQLLREHDLIVMSGYGWNDRGINGWLSEWFWTSPRNRVILLHRSPEEIRDHSRSYMWHRYNELVENGQLIPVRKWFGEISIDELDYVFH